jgi:exonuclease III
MYKKMILRLAFFAILAVSIPFSGFSQKGTKAKLGFLVVSYNVENLYDTIDDPKIDDAEFLPSAKANWNSVRYQKKINDLAKVISSVGENTLPGLVGLYEIENKAVLTDLANAPALKKQKYGIAHQDSPDRRGVDVGLLYDPSVFRFIDQKALAVTLPDDTSFITRDILYVKGLAIKSDTLHVFLNHWPSRREGNEKSMPRRLAAASVLKAAVDKILKDNKNAKIIIMGDFNDEPTDKSLTEALKATNEKMPKTADELYNLMYDKKLNKEGTYSYKGEWNMLDNLIVSQGLLNAKKGLSTTYDAGSIFKADWMLYANPKTGEKTPNRTYGGPNYFGGISDHLPVYFYMTKN